MWILVGWGVADLFLAGLGDPEPLLALTAGLPLSLDPDRDLLLGGGEGDTLFLGASTPSPPLLVSSMGLLGPGEEPGSLSVSGLRDPGFPFPSLLDFLLFFFLSSLSLLLLESELDSLLESLELSLLELELELLAFLFFWPLSPLFSLLLPFRFSLSSSLLSEELPPLLLLAFFSCFSLGMVSCSVGGLSLSSPGGSTPPPVPMVFK